MKTLLFLLLCMPVLAGDTVVTVKRPDYLGGGSVSTVKSGAKTIAKIVSVDKHKYAGGGKTSKVIIKK